MNYETNTFGTDIILSLSEKVEPYFCNPKLQNWHLNEDFVQTMTISEQETDYLLSTYYDYDIRKKYENIQKTCTVRDLKREEAIAPMIVEKIEDS